MEGKLILSCALILCITALPVHGYYISGSVPPVTEREKVTKLHFFFHDIFSGQKPTVIRVAGPNLTTEGNPVETFGGVFATDDPLTVGTSRTSELIGSAQGLYVSSGQDVLSLVVYIDFGFNKGEFNGSSLSMFSRNPILETERELAVVGGRGKFRMARGFANARTSFFNTSNGDAIVEYNVTVFHY